RAEGQRLAQEKIGGHDGQPCALIFGAPVAMQVGGGNAGELEVGVVEDGEVEAGPGQDACDLRLPNTLGQPCAARAEAEVAVERGAEKIQLRTLMRGRNDGEDGLVVAAAEELEAAGGEELAQKVEVLRMPFGQPVEEEAAEVQVEAQPGTAAGGLKEGQVGGLVGLLEDRIEVARGLVGVQHYGKCQGHEPLSALERGIRMRVEGIHER